MPALSASPASGVHPLDIGKRQEELIKLTDWVNPFASRRQEELQQARLAAHRFKDQAMAQLQAQHEAAMRCPVRCTPERIQLATSFAGATGLARAEGSWSQGRTSGGRERTSPRRPGPRTSDLHPRPSSQQFIKSRSMGLDNCWALCMDCE
jgi:hypothetical protein